MDRPLRTIYFNFEGYSLNDLILIILFNFFKAKNPCCTFLGCLFPIMMCCMRSKVREARKIDVRFSFFHNIDSITCT